jgi:Ran GTPase-activating protein (RanGAP) involved in mRNA processing and transport
MKRIEELMKNTFEQRKFLRLIEEENLTRVSISAPPTSQDAQDLATALSVSSSVTHLTYATDDYDSSPNSNTQRNTIIQGLNDNMSMTHLDLHKNFTTIWDQAKINQTQQQGQYRSFPNMLKLNHSLVYIDLSNNGFGDASAKLIGEGLKGNKSIKHLNLSNNNITGAGIEAICLMLQFCAAGVLEYLNLSLNPLGHQGALYLQPLLQSTTSIKSLNLAQGQFVDVGVKPILISLADNKSILSLNFSSNMFNLDHAKLLASMLIGNNTLQELILKGNNLGTEGYKLVNEALRLNHSITSLDLNQSSIIGKESGLILADYLRTNKTVKHLDIGLNSSLGKEGIKEIIEPLNKNSSLISFNLSGCNLGEAGGMLLSKVLNSQQCLKKIDLAGNNLSDTGMILLAKGIKAVGTITHLNVSNNNIAEQGGEAAFCALGNIKYLNISNNKLTTNLMSSIAAILKEDKALLSLDMSNNQSITTGIIHLLDALENNHTLTSLDISNLGFGLNNQTIFLSLKKNYSLASIKLNNNITGTIVQHAPQITNYFDDLIKSHPSIVSMELKGLSNTISSNLLIQPVKDCASLIHFRTNETTQPNDFSNSIIANRLACQDKLQALIANPEGYLKTEGDSSWEGLFTLVKQICALHGQKFLAPEISATETAVPNLMDCLLTIHNLTKEESTQQQDDYYHKLAQIDLTGLAEYIVD